jgi:hypothetical protein
MPESGERLVVNATGLFPLLLSGADRSAPCAGISPEIPSLNRG